MENEVKKQEVAEAPKESENTHILLPASDAQALYNYLGAKPASEVINLMKALENSPGVRVVPQVPETPVEAQSEEAAS